MIKIVTTITCDDRQGTIIDLNYEVDAKYKHVREYYQENSTALRVIRAISDEITKMVMEQLKARDIQKKSQDNQIKKFFGLKE